MSTPLALDRVTALAIDPGAHVAVGGAVTTSVDGSTFDAPDLFDLAAGGLRVVSRPQPHAFVLASTGSPGTGCIVAGVDSPCLVPRLAALAHARLRTAAELQATLSGAVQVTGVVGPPPAPSPFPWIAGVIALVTASLGVVAVLRWRARSALGRVRAAAREVLRATRGDPGLERVRAEVRSMVARAAEIDAERRASARKLTRTDRASLERRRAAAARSSVPEAADTLAWLTAEHAEAERLQDRVAASVLGLQRIESALRVIALRLRGRGDARARVARVDPVDAAAAELAWREEALREVDGVVH